MSTNWKSVRRKYPDILTYRAVSRKIRKKLKSTIFSTNQPPLPHIEPDKTTETDPSQPSFITSKNGMLMLSEVSILIHDILATDQGNFVEQQSDGSYRKKTGKVTPAFIENVLRNEESIAIYQKNVDLSINWICFDFDILKDNLESAYRGDAEKELSSTVSRFCSYLESIKIPYLLEFSGNRGFHIWVTFKEHINYRAGYDIQQEILDKSDINYNEKLIAIDRFPPNKTPTDGVGLGVKMPLSKHKKSNNYSYLLTKDCDLNSAIKTNTLTDNIISKSREILKCHSPISISDLERSLNVFFENYSDEHNQKKRIRKIQVERKGILASDILTLWKASKPLDLLAEKIEKSSDLSHGERVLIVGLLCNVYSRDNENLSTEILHDIFSRINNYNKNITEKAISQLRNFSFPTQTQIENTLGKKFEDDLNTKSLLETCIPKYITHEDATFCFSNKDIEISRAAESTYLFMNDEVQSKIVIEDLSAKSSSELLQDLEYFIDNPSKSNYYVHTRHEENKIRELVTLDASTRVATTCILKQISYYLDLNENTNSHGYQINKGFSGGYIFKPWLYLWLKFISNISSALENDSYKDYYIIKTDIRSFYDTIPHDNLIRLLFGDGFSPISTKIDEMDENTQRRYKDCVKSLFILSENINSSRIGLPQGPAYARYLAELYLAKIDEEFTKRLDRGEIVLYQRYVDDIFIISKNKNEAKSILNELASKLSDLGLDLNEDKTLISNISRFHNDFDNYRSQSKYSVDLISKNLDISSENQKDTAIDDFMELVSSDTAHDDLSFIFSHLQGLSELNEIKMKQVEPALANIKGRGSLFKNLFNFVFQLHEGWEIILEKDQYSELQSEVLTSCLINAIEINTEHRIKLISIANSIVPKLSYTPIVYEHLAYLKVAFNCNINIKEIEPEYFINALNSIENYRKALVSQELFNHISIALNDIKSFQVFIKVIYACSFNENIDASQLNNVSSLFYSKASVERENGTFNFESDLKINDPHTTLKFYYLLCLNSTSTTNSSIELVEDMWRFCVHIYNRIDGSTCFKSPNWLEHLEHLKIDNGKLNWIIASIVDGNIFRGGASDENHIFERFHNALLVHVSLGGTETKELGIQKNLDQLKEKSTFYNWLIDSQNVKIFPENNKKWFERNIIENGIISLKKDNLILLRKQSEQFEKSNNITESINGYSELLAQHNSYELKSFKTLFNDTTIVEQLSILLEYLIRYKEEKTFPGLFCPSPVLNKEDGSIFNSEFCYHQRIISINTSKSITSLDLSTTSIVITFLEQFSTTDTVTKLLLERYINNLSNDLDLFLFIKNLHYQLEEIDELINEVYLDLAVSAAIYLTLSTEDSISNIKLFVKQYSQFHNDNRDKHIFAVDRELEIGDQNPEILLNSVIRSLRAISDKTLLPLNFYLYNDINSYKVALEKLISESCLEENKIKLENFSPCDVKIQHTSNTIKLNQKKYNLIDVKILNPITKEITNFEQKNTSFLKTSDHIFITTLGNTAYLISINLHISSIFINLEERTNTIINIENLTHSYPINDQTKSTIKSIPNFLEATEVIQNHRAIDISGAENILSTWLCKLPAKFHVTFIDLIAAHESMSDHDLNNFTDFVTRNIDNKIPLLLIKNANDHNGTHRILARNQDIPRHFPRFNPLAVANKKPNEITIISDILISGTQLSTAFKYYFGSEKYPENSNLFAYNSAELDIIKNAFINITTFNICCVMYTHRAVSKLQKLLNDLTGKEISIRIINGRDISKNAFFGSSQKLSERNRGKIQETLSNADNLNQLNSYLSSNTRLLNSSTNIADLNLITRYLSLPKKSFDFLFIALKSGEESHPFKRILELNEM